MKISISFLPGWSEVVDAMNWTGKTVCDISSGCPCVLQISNKETFFLLESFILPCKITYPYAFHKL